MNMSQVAKAQMTGTEIIKPAYGSEMPKWGNALLPKMIGSRPIYWLDITDFVAYAQDGNTTVSGIQRVVANLIVHRAMADVDVIPVIPEFDRQRVLAADAEAVQTLVQLLQGGSASRETIRKALDAVYDSRIEVSPRAIDSYVMVGAFWIYYHHDLLIRLRMEGVRISLFIHDLIQIKNPEYLSEVANRTFRRSLIDVLSVCDQVLTNSDFVKGEVEEFMGRRLNLSLPVTAVQLPTELPSAVQSATQPSRFSALSGQDYVLCVGTIEIRKNHSFLIKIWEALATEFGDAKIPRLVFVGKWGWNIEELKEEISRTKAADRWLQVYNNISDAELDYLYENCLFTVYPSFAEGWGLPVGESLARGKPCVTSSATSMPEVGGRFARYVDPFDWQSGLAVIRPLLLDRSDLAAWERNIRENFKPKTWLAFCQELYDALKAFTWPSTRPVCNYRFSPGTLYDFGEARLPRLDLEGDLMVTARMTRSKGWGPCEQQLAWANEANATLELQTVLPTGWLVDIYLCLSSPAPGARIVEITAGTSAKTVVLAVRRSVHKLTGCVGDNGILTLAFDFKTNSAGKTVPAGEPLFGISSIGFADVTVPDHHMRLIEALTLAGCEVPHPVDDGRGEVLDPVKGARTAIEFLSATAPLFDISALWLQLARSSAKARSWGWASRFYARYLRAKPESAAAWKQFGHVEKERGRFENAYVAYSFVRHLNPGDHEVLSHYEFVRNVLRER
ncbi:Glycosyltransferase involved in cell wall bisynthesis [Rhizobium sp. RU20A]|uniref:glycosyltransferase family 4 protein n=1 Tax=Rhizobium sp. RU20A TaxID=1907412 RepID=UPI00095737EF|nr:glycosyltransferase family 1 protein [Rhizobium sp. RU20A]SIQ58747.1 Glycosyltransferase involved in cell wall bisynthesis [Rhizobium sp. RU20A]